MLKSSQPVLTGFTLGGTMLKQMKRTLQRPPKLASRLLPALKGLA